MVCHTLMTPHSIDGIRARTNSSLRLAILAAMAVLCWTSAAVALAAQLPLSYPPTRQTNQIHDYHGVKVPDPYRWLEDDNSPETKAWVEAENKVTFAYLEQIPERKSIKERLTRL